MLSQEFYFYFTWSFSHAGIPGGDTGCAMTLPGGDDFQAFMWFRAIDIDCSGAISFAEVRSFLERFHFQGSDDAIQNFLNAGDADGDGELDYREFYLLWTGTQSNAPESGQNAGGCPWTGDGAPAGAPGNGDLHLADCLEDCCCRLEVFYDGAWGTICDDSFNDDAGVIACRQMGLPSTDVRIMVGGSGSGEAFSVPGSGQIWLDGVDCSSTDPKRLEDCNHK
jgi:hypothetical protein